MLSAAILLAACHRAEPQPTTPPPPAPSTTSLPNIETFQLWLTAGNRQPRLTDDEKRAFAKARVWRPRIILKLCIDAAGVPTELKVLESTGRGDADETIIAQVRAWRFYVPPDKRQPRCTGLQFRYVLRD